jgi:hypothetical protein
MKTAVEWLIDELYKQGISLYTPELIAEAKEMEKEQQMKTYKVALMRGISYDEDVYHENKWRDPEKYYNETFKQQEQ